MSEPGETIKSIGKKVVTLLTTVGLVASVNSAVEASGKGVETCDFNNVPAEGSVCTIENHNYIYKGALKIDQPSIDALGILSGMTQVPFALNTLEAGKEPIYGIWVEQTPNTDTFWKDFMATQK